MEIQVVSIPITELIVLFLIYLGMHISFGALRNDLKQFDDKENKKKYKNVSFLFTWFPAMWVIFVIMYLVIR